MLTGVDRTAGTTTVQGEVVAAMSLIDNAVFLSNRIEDSFAVVDTRVSGIHLRPEDRDEGRCAWTGSAQTVPVNGRLPASQTLPSGNYQDTIIATVTF